MGAKKELTDTNLAVESSEVWLDRGEERETEIVLAPKAERTIFLLPARGSFKKKLTVYLKGEGSRLKILGLILGREGQEHQIEIRIIHQGRRTSAHTEVRAVLFKRSRLNFAGLIKIEKGAKNTLSLLENRVLLLGEKARADSLPSLEIEADEVKASHAATVGRVDEATLFYLQSRGLPRAQAAAMVAEGFLQTILGKITEESALKEVRKYLWQNLLNPADDKSRAVGLNDA